MTSVDKHDLSRRTNMTSVNRHTTYFYIIDIDIVSVLVFSFFTFAAFLVFYLLFFLVFYFFMALGINQVTYSNRKFCRSMFILILTV